MIKSGTREKGGKVRVKTQLDGVPIPEGTGEQRHRSTPPITVKVRMGFRGPPDFLLPPAPHPLPLQERCAQTPDLQDRPAQAAELARYL